MGHSFRSVANHVRVALPLSQFQSSLRLLSRVLMLCVCVCVCVCVCDSGFRNVEQLRDVTWNKVTRETDQNYTVSFAFRLYELSYNIKVNGLF